jgi:hypothetical protein
MAQQRVDILGVPCLSLSDEHSMFSSSDMEGSLVGGGGHHHHPMHHQMHHLPHNSSGGMQSNGGSGSGQGNVYEVEHLATFQLSEELNLPSDGMKRLLHMEKNGFGIWSQKMRLRLESRYIVILDFENGVRSCSALLYTLHL